MPVLLVALVGCYSPQRDLGLDPVNKSVLHILSSEYEQATGAVALRWEYIGAKSVDFFAIERRSDAAYVEIDRWDGGQDASRYVRVGTYRDEDLLSGERLSYRVVARQADGTVITAPSVDIRVPGAQVGAVNRDPLTLAVQVTWVADNAGIASYDVVRSIDGGTGETVQRLTDPGARSFWDRDVQGNAQYTYVIETRLASGVVLRSRPVEARFYGFGAVLPVESVRPETESIRLTQGAPAINGGTLALIARADQLALFFLRYEVGVGFDGSPRVRRTLSGTAFPDLSRIQPASADVVGPGIGEIVSLPRVFVGGVDAAGRVTLAGYAAPLFNRVWAGPADWQVSDTRARVHLARDASGHIFVGIGNEVRVYNDAGGQLGVVGVPISSISDIAVFGRTLCVISNGESRLLRGALGFTGGVLLDVVWEESRVSPTAVAMAYNAFGQLFVLGVNGTIEIHSETGVPLMSWSLPNGNYDAGDIAIDGNGTNVVQVSNGRGDVLTYVP